MADSFVKVNLGDRFRVDHDVAAGSEGLYIEGTKVVGTVYGTAIPNLTDSTGGTVSTTAIEDLANGSTYATDHAAIENNFASLTAKVNLIIDALSSHGLITEA